MPSHQITHHTTSCVLIPAVIIIFQPLKALANFVFEDAEITTATSSSKVRQPAVSACNRPKLEAFQLRYQVKFILQTARNLCCSHEAMEAHHLQNAQCVGLILLNFKWSVIREAEERGGCESQPVKQESVWQKGALWWTYVCMGGTYHDFRWMNQIHQKLVDIRLQFIGWNRLFVKLFRRYRVMRHFHNGYKGQAVREKKEFICTGEYAALQLCIVFQG